jgi:tetratricopeptide (TPR) repeat protein
VPSTFAQHAKLYGTIVDETGNPLVKAKLVLEPVKEGDEPARGTRLLAETKKKGDYFFGMVSPGRYRFIVENVGNNRIRHVSYRILDIERRETDKKEGDVSPDQPFALSIEDGQEIICDLKLAPAVEIDAGGGKKQVVTEEGALAALAKRVQSGECDSALPEIEKVLTTTHETAMLRYLQGFCLAAVNRLDEAVTSLDRAIQMQPDLQGAHLLRGQVLVRAGRGEQAEPDFKQEIASTQDKQLRGDAYLALAELYKEQKRNDEAIAAFEKLIEIAPERPEPYVDLAALYTSTGRPEKAAEVIEKSKSTGSADPRSLLNVGISYMNRHEYDKAAETFQRVIGMSPQNEDLALAHGLLARCQLNGGRFDEAIPNLRKAVELDPTGKDAEENRQILKALEKK